MESLKVLVIGPAVSFGGYGSVARTYIDGLHELGHDVKIDNFQDYHNGYPLGKERTVRYIENDVKNNPGWEPDVMLLCTNGNFPKTHVPTVCSMGWEGAELPPGMTKTIRNLDVVTIWSSFMRGMYEKHHDSVRVVPIGVDVERFKPDPVEHDDFVVVANGKWEFRKNYAGLIRAFSEAFKDKRDARLHIKTWPFAAEAPEIQQIARNNNPHGVNVNVEVSACSEDDLIKWYNGADVYAQCSRYEGYGVPYLEAMSCGVPLISSLEGGHREFVTDEFSYLVDGKMKNVINHSVYRGKTVMFEPDRKDLVKKLTYAYENRDELRKRGEVARSEALNYSNKRVSELMVDALREAMSFE